MLLAERLRTIDDCGYLQEETSPVDSALRTKQGIRP